MRSFAIEEPGSPVPALYATLHTRIYIESVIISLVQRKQSLKEFSQPWPDHLQEVWQGRQGQGHEDFLDFSEVLLGMKLVGAALKQKYLSSGGEGVHSTALL